LWINPLNAELNPICHLLALLGGANIVVISRLRVKLVIETSRHYDAWSEEHKIMLCSHFNSLPSVIKLTRRSAQDAFTEGRNVIVPRTIWLRISCEQLTAEITVYVTISKLHKGGNQRSLRFVIREFEVRIQVSTLTVT